MKLEINSNELVLLICGCWCSYENMSDPIIEKCGEYHGGFSDDWEWSKAKLLKLSDTELLHVWNKLKQDQSKYDF